MSEESAVVVCPNPKCRRQIEEPILLTNISVTPAEKYDACPHCFTKLELKPPLIQEEVAEEPEPLPSEDVILEEESDSSPQLWERVKDLIARSNGSQEEIETKIEEPEPQPLTEKEKEHSGCPQSFGYLANRPPDAPIPPGCLLCPKIVDCMLKVEE